MILNKWLPSRSSIIPWYIKKASSRKIERSRWTNHPCHLHFLQALVPKYWIGSANLSDAATSMLTLQTSFLTSLFTALNLPLIRQHLKLCSFFAFYSTFLDSAELEAHPFFIGSKIWWTDAWLFTNVFCGTDLVTWNYSKGVSATFDCIVERFTGLGGAMMLVASFSISVVSGLESMIALTSSSRICKDSSDKLLPESSISSWNLHLCSKCVSPRSDRFVFYTTH